MDGDASEDRRPSKRARKQSACSRCQKRKQRCDFTFPACSNCQKANTECVRPDLSGVSMPTQALQERVAYLESRLAHVNNDSRKSVTQQDSPESFSSATSSRVVEERKEQGDITQVVGFLSLGAEPAYVGSSSGISLAANLAEMVQATVWNKVLSVAQGHHASTPVSIADIRQNGAGPPDDEFGDRLLESYFSFTHAKYPFLVRNDIMRIHANRLRGHAVTTEQKFDTFKLYMVYAIGSTSLKLTQHYDSTPPEKFMMTALQYVSAARKSHSINNVIAMTLLVIYHLRSPSNTGIWYMVGLAMRTCIDLGLHREAHYSRQELFHEEVKRRLFWSVYSLERVIALTLGRPTSVADQDIDARLPLNMDDDVQDPEIIASFLNGPQLDHTTPLSLCIHLIRIRRIESRIQRKIYRVDKKPSALVSRIAPLLQLLEEWRTQMPVTSPPHFTYATLHYYRAVRLILQPFLGILQPQDSRIGQCLEASGQICQIFKRLLSGDSYNHSFVAVHSVYVAGMTMCYCLWLCRDLCTFSASNDLRACSSVLHIMAERAPSVRKYRDVFEELVDATMEHMAHETHDPTASPIKLRPDTVSQFTKAGDMVIQMLNHMSTVEASPQPAQGLFEGYNPLSFSRETLEGFPVGQMGFVDFDQGYFA